MSTFERPCVDGMLIAQLRKTAESLLAGKPWRERERATLELEDWIREYLGQPRPLRVVAGPFLRTRPTTAECHLAATDDGRDDGPGAA